MKQLQWRGRCSCGDNYTDITFDIEDQVNRLVKNPVIRMAARRLVGWISGQREPQVFLVTCNKCGRSFQVTISSNDSKRG